jgi:hypothetical protein
LVDGEIHPREVFENLGVVVQRKIRHKSARRGVYVLLIDDLAVFVIIFLIA